MVGDGLEPGGGVSRVAVSWGFDGLAAPASGLADLYNMSLRYVSLQGDYGTDHLVHGY